MRGRLSTPDACDDLLADAASRGIRHLVVQPGALTLLTQHGAVLGVWIHAWVDAGAAVDAASRDHLEGVHVDDLTPEVAERIRSIAPSVTISTAVVPASDIVRKVARIADLVVPLAYRRGTAEVARLLGEARAAAGTTRLWAGLRAYPERPELAREQARAAAATGCEGAILFAYDPTERAVLDEFGDA